MPEQNVGDGAEILETTQARQDESDLKISLPAARNKRFRVSILIKSKPSLYIENQTLTNTKRMARTIQTHFLTGWYEGKKLTAHTKKFDQSSNQAIDNSMYISHLRSIDLISQPINQSTNLPSKQWSLF